MRIRGEDAGDRSLELAKRKLPLDVIHDGLKHGLRLSVRRVRIRELKVRRRTASFGDANVDFRLLNAAAF